MIVDIETRAASMIERHSSVLASDATMPSGEDILIRAFKLCQAAGLQDERLPIGPCDLIRYEVQLRNGRADIVVFHVNGAATVIEAKDGNQGARQVLAGIGQASWYATQLAATQGAIRSVRRALMWTSTGSPGIDAEIEDACASAGVIALPYQSTRSLAALELAVRQLELQDP